MSKRTRRRSRSLRKAVATRRLGQTVSSATSRRRLGVEQLEDRRVLAVAIAGPFSGIIADVVNGLSGIGDTDTQLTDILSATASPAAYVAFPGEVNDVSVQDSILDLFLTVDEGNSHVPVFVMPPAFNADFISNIDIGFSFFAELTVPIGELIELPDVSAIIPNGAGIFNLIPGISNNQITDLTDDLTSFVPGIDDILGIVDLDLSPFVPDLPGPIGDVFDLITQAFTGFTADAITIATLDGNDSVDLRGLGATATVLAGDGNDDIFDGGGLGNTLMGGAGDDGIYANLFKSAATTTTIDGGDGSDTLLIDLTNTDDTLTLTFDTAGQVTADFNSSPTQTFNLTSVEKIQIMGDTGDDGLVLNIADAAGLFPLINFDGGDGTDSITLQGAAAITSNQHFVGPFASGTGTINLNNGGMVINYEGLDPVAAPITDLLMGPLSITATPNANTINLMGLNDTGLVEIDSDLFFVFDNKTGLTVSAGAGADIVDVQLGVNQGFAAGANGSRIITLNGDAGEDVLRVSPGLAPLIGTVLNGGANNDSLFGGDFGDTLNGGAGNDLLDGGNSLGNTLNSYNGGTGDDTILVPGTESADTIRGVQGTNSTIQWNFNGNANRFDVFSAVERFFVDAGGSDDSISLLLSENLTLPTPYIVDGGSNSFADILTFEDNGPGDRILLRQGPDDVSGTIYPDALGPISYSNINQLRFTPLNTITGGTGFDGGGRIIVLDQDPFEFNGTLPNAVDLAALTAAVHNPTIDLPGDEDWYRFRAPKIGTFSFEVLFDRIATLPGTGELTAQVYRENGTLIANSVDFADGDVVSFSANRLEDYYLRVIGANDNVINVYDVNPIEVDLVGPRVADPDGAGPQQAVQVTGSPNFDLFDPKPATADQGPTPLVNSITINLEDILNREDHLPTDLFNRPVPNGRAPGDLYPALDALIAAQFGHFEIRGDSVGIIPIQSVTVVNDPPVVGQIATARVQLNFFEPLPDDRFTLTIFDTLVDPAGNAFDGNSNAAEPSENPEFPSGDFVAGGDFVARFTVDSRPEIGTYVAASAFLDINGNFVWDPDRAPIGEDATNVDLVFTLPLVDSATGQAAAGGFGPHDLLFAGNFASGQNPADGFDKLAAFGNFTDLTQGISIFRWLVDTNNDGVVDPNAGDLFTQQPRFINFAGGEVFDVAPAIPIAGNFDNNAANGDEVGLYFAGSWLLDTDRDFILETTDTFIPNVPGQSLIGAPIVGDFDGDGNDDLAVYNDSLFLFDLTADGNLDGMPDDNIIFGFSGVLERPVAADMDEDGIDDIGLWVPRNSGQTLRPESEWFFLLSGFAEPVAGTVNTLDHAFTPEPFGNDLYAQFGDELALPIVGNFDPPLQDDVVIDTDSTLVGDYDDSGTVDHGDYDLWRASFGSSTELAADGNGDGRVDSADYTIWRNNFGATSSSSAAASAPVAVLASSTLGASQGSVDGGSADGEQAEATKTHDLAFVLFGSNGSDVPQYGGPAPVSSSAPEGDENLLLELAFTADEEDRTVEEFRLTDDDSSNGQAPRIDSLEVAWPTLI